MAAITETQFKKTLKALGLSTYVKAGTKITISSPARSRNDRSSLLKEIAKIVPGSTFKDDGRSGYIDSTIGTEKVKIFLKPAKTASGIILKPQFFSGITDSDISFSSYYSTLIASIQDNKKLDGQQKSMLVDLVDYHTSFSSQALVKWKKSFKASGDCIPVNTINNDFGEILGPLAIINKQLLPIDSKKAKVFLPYAGNYPLLDYIIKTDKKQYNISAKSGDTTNTLKPSDVKKLIDDSTVLKRKYSNTPQYNVVRILAETSWKQGPIDALMYLKSEGYKEAKWIKNATYSEPIRQQSENSIVEISRNSLDFTQMYVDATDAKVYYVKFKMLPDGTPEWKLVDSAEDKAKRPQATKRIAFRSKNYVGRPNGDKLGFQV
jgi:hypothetical protein